MSASYDRAIEIVQKLQAAGVRATTDPSVFNPPAVLVNPPARRYDLACGWTATWTLTAAAPTPGGSDRTSWQMHDDLADAVAAVLPVSRADPVTATINGVQYPAYAIQIIEALGD